MIDLLAELKMKAGELDEAEKLYELARKDDPFHTKWIAGLARVHLRQKKTAQFLNDLAMIAANDADDIAVRKALAERHLAAGDAAAAEKWANECLYIDVYDPSVHVLLADAQAAGKKYAEAIEEYQTALDAQSQETQRPEGQACPGPAWQPAAATPPRPRSTACSRPTPSIPRPRSCFRKSSTRRVGKAGLTERCTCASVANPSSLCPSANGRGFFPPLHRGGKDRHDSGTTPSLRLARPGRDSRSAE